MSPLPPEVKFHWSLCPMLSRPALSREVEFDLRKPVGDIVIYDFKRPFPHKLRQAEANDVLGRAVCSHLPPELVIRYRAFPNWEVTVKRKDGGPLQVRDVFEAIYESLQVHPSRKERAAYMKDPKAMGDAFIQRCEENPPAVCLAEKKAGLRRVDLLMGESLFKGLMEPYNQDFWVAHFGPRRSITPQSMPASSASDSVPIAGESHLGCRVSQILLTAAGMTCYS